MNKPIQPLNHPLKPALYLSLGCALVLAGGSAGGLLLPGRLYPTEALRRAFLANDAANLLLGLPVLLATLFLARRGSLAGLLFLPGTLLFILYTCIAYTAALPLATLFWLYLFLGLLSLGTTGMILRAVDFHGIKQRLEGAVPARLAGGVLAGMGLLFMLRAGAVIFQAHTTPTDQAVALADLLLTPAWIAGGVMLWLRKDLGYTAGAGLLFQAGLLFAGLLLFFGLAPFLNGSPFAWVDFIVVLAMSLVCFIPLGLFARAAAKS